MPKYWLIGGGAFVGVLLVVSVVVALMQEDVALKEGTPERTVQLYLRAVQDEDFRAAHGFLSAELKEECPPEDLAARNFSRARDLSDSRVTLEDTRHFTTTTVVVARVTRVRGSGPFGTSESSHEQPYTLRLEDDEWRITQNPWPYHCSPEPPPKREAFPTREPPPTPRP